MMNSTLELMDSAFLKATRLLHSKAKDSADILKQMYDDSVAQKLGIKDHKSSSIIKQDNIFPPQRPSPKYPMNEGATVGAKGKKFEEISRKLELGKRPEKFQSDSDPGLLPSDAKRMQLDSPRASPIPYRHPSPTSNLTEDKILDSSDSGLEKNSSSVEPGKSPHQWALELGLVCIVCRSIDVAPGNQLIECQECHNLYHQECHRPPAIGHDVNDPRLVWYCSKCKKNLKKIVTLPKPQKPTPKPSSTTSKETTNTFSKAFKSEGFSLQHPFKRVEPKSPASNSSTNSNKRVGLAGLAADLNNKTLSHNSSALNSTKTMSLKSSKLTAASQQGSGSQIKGMASFAMSFKSSTKSSTDK